MPHPPILTSPTRAPSDPHPAYHPHDTFPPPFGTYELITKIVCVPILSCLRYPDLGDELHIKCQCPTTKVVLDRFAAKFQWITRLLDLPYLTTFSAEETTQLVLGNLPAQALQKELQRWIQEATPICGEYAYVLRTHITSLQPAVVDMSSDDEGAAS